MIGSSEKPAGNQRLARASGAGKDKTGKLIGPQRVEDPAEHRHPFGTAGQQGCVVLLLVQVEEVFDQRADQGLIRAAKGQVKPVIVAYQGRVRVVDLVYIDMTGPAVFDHFVNKRQVAVDSTGLDQGKDPFVKVLRKFIHDGCSCFLVGKDRTDWLEPGNFSIWESGGQLARCGAIQVGGR